MLYDLDLYNTQVIGLSEEEENLNKLFATYINYDLKTIANDGKINNLMANLNSITNIKLNYQGSNIEVNFNQDADETFQDTRDQLNNLIQIGAMVESYDEFMQSEDILRHLPSKDFFSLEEFLKENASKFQILDSVKRSLCFPYDEVIFVNQKEKCLSFSNTLTKDRNEIISNRYHSYCNQLMDLSNLEAFKKSLIDNEELSINDDFRRLIRFDNSKESSNDNHKQNFIEELRNLYKLKSSYDQQLNKELEDYKDIENIMNDKQKHEPFDFNNNNDTELHDNVEQKDLIINMVENQFDETYLNENDEFKTMLKDTCYLQSLNTIIQDEINE